VSLTYHKREKILRCHYCGWSVKPPSSCPSCGSLDIEYSGFGTEFIEEEVRAKFPSARIVRADSDSLTGRGDLEEKLSLFKEKKADILLGTQMVAKGLNFPGVRLVGVVMADTGLHLPDFRAAERTFALIVQVAGRAGRFFPDGEVIVQTYDPQRDAVALACSGRVEEFYEKELNARRELNFPPFSRLVRLVFRSASETKTRDAAETAARSIADSSDPRMMEILGPAECPLAKIAANFRCHILLRGKRLSYMQQLVRTFLASYKTPSGVYIEVDVDPISLL
ncbi:MAG: primosomal protein N', partial [Treponema maltophilum]